ncbi:hypothetical protein BAE44_0002605 [Dichanthelium oligosanthes]|uniref:Uncharacterized protein n=1 Tax=Dichanthelium oligosanthes TaxID=888268 RepID=A0A1E5WG41_9POAL|nr:hypothetical protein BAE44_0002605 [Dichanthelium oligosanthes]
MIEHMYSIIVVLQTTRHILYHNVLGVPIIPRLNLLFQLATDFRLKYFARFKNPIIDENVHLYRSQLLFYGLDEDINTSDTLKPSLTYHHP